MADGRILIDTKIDARGIVDGTDKVIAAARRMATQVDGLSNSVKASFSRQADAIQKASRLYVEQGEKIDGLKKKLEELKSEEVPTEQYQNIESEIKKAESALDKLIEKQIRFTESGGKIKSRTFEQMEYDIERAQQRLSELKETKEEMETSGSAYAPGSEANAEKIAALEAKITTEKQKQEDMGRSLETTYNSLRGKVEQYSEEMNNAAESTEKLSEATKRNGNDFKSLGRMMLRYGIGVESLFTLINKLRSALVEGFKNLSQYSTNTNAAISGLISSLAQCKNALATAFDPILRAVAPALNYMISLVTAAATAVAQLIAILTGKGTFIKATKVQKDYANSLKATGGAAKGAGKDAEGALAPFDRLTVLAEDASGGGGGGGGGAGIEDMFETVPVDNNLTKAIDAIKAKMAELRDLFKAGFFEGLGDLSVLDSIRGNIESIRDSLVDIFSDGAVQEAANNMINTLAYNMGRITGAFASIGLSILDNITGGFALYLEEAKERIKQWLISMFDITGSISTIVANFMVALGEVFEALRGEAAKQLTADIIKIFSDAFMGVTELAGKLARDVLDTILTPFTNNAGKIKEAVENTIKPIETVFGTLAQSVAETFDRLNQMYDEHLAPLFDSIRDGISEVVGKFLDGYNQHVAPVLDALAKRFSEVWKETIQPLINDAIKLIGTVADLVKEKWENQIKPAIDWIATNVMPMIAPVIDGIGSLFLDKFEQMGLALDLFLKGLEALIKFISGTFSGDWKSSWDGLKTDFSAMWESLPGIVEKVKTNVINTVGRMVDEIKGLVDKAIGFIKGISEGGSIGVATGGVSNMISQISYSSGRMIPEPIHLPRLASGTVVPPRAGEFAAILGDNKRETEVVSPLSTMKQAMLEALAQAGSMGGGDINLTVNLDGRAVYQSIVKRNRQEKNRTGLNPLIV